MASDATRQLFLTGLRNAHAMEHQARELMERQIERSTDYPQVEARLRQHLEETKTQIERLNTIFDELGESHSEFKDAAMAFLGNMAAIGHAVAPDEILKNQLANNAFENYEIAAYKSLLALAQDGGASASAVNTLKQNLAEEEAMAKWVSEHVGEVTLDYARRTHAS
jgi:ferritin-like metal-binding protein YciE